MRARRRRLGSAAWAELLRRCAASGLSVAAFCRREGLTASSFYRWRDRLGAVPAASTRADVARGGEFLDLGPLHTASTSRRRFQLQLEWRGLRLSWVA